MDFSRFLTPKDFFNYYIAGAIWIADILYFIHIINPLFLNYFIHIYHHEESVQSITTICELIILVIIPYIVGFTLEPLSASVTKILRKMRDDDPIRWVTFEESKNAQHYGKRLPKAQIDRISTVIEGRLGYTLEPKYWFYPIRAYVIDNGGASVGLAARAQHLANFTESLIIPFPILCAIATWIVTTFGWCNEGLFYAVKHPFLIPIIFTSIIVCLFLTALVLAGMFWMLFQRYLELRREWAVHIYREFLVITAKDKRYRIPSSLPGRAS
jgi:hypothetical protein